MLKQGYLASTLCYLSLSHTKEIIDNYIYQLDDIFEQVSKCELDNSIENFLEVPQCHSGFKRLN